MNPAAHSARAVAARVLQSTLAEGESLSRSAPRLLATLTDERERAFAQACIYGVLRHYYSLRAELAPLLRRPLRAKDFTVEATLLCALFQIRHMRVPSHAAVSASVEALRELGKSWACALANGVLRAALRRPARQVSPEASVRFEHPPWLIAATRADWPDRWQAILDANNCHPPLTLRVNRLRSEREACLQRLAQAGLEAERGACAGSALRLAAPRPVERLAEFTAGVVSVQDEAAQLAAGLLGLSSGQRVLDACAAPGGKTGHILEQLDGRGTLVALDADAGRLEDVRSNLERLDLRGELVHADATAPPAWWDGVPFDRILLDAPCSAVGVIRRHPDIRFHRRAGDIEHLAANQQRLLRCLWPLLRPGGTLLYATCSYLRAENDDVIDAFLAHHADAEIDPIDAAWGCSTRHGRQILPGEQNMDGFFYTRVLKVSPAA